MKKEIKWGIIGCGEIANKFVESARAVDGAKVIAADSRTPGKAVSFAKKHQIENAYSDYSELLSNEAVDAVYVATTHNFHYENTREALLANKPVLCEKPFTVNALEMNALIALAERQQIFLMEALWTRFLPAVVQLRRWFAEELIGKIKQIGATFSFYFPFDPNHRLFNPDLAGGRFALAHPCGFVPKKNEPKRIKASISVHRAQSHRKFPRARG